MSAPSAVVFAHGEIGARCLAVLLARDVRVLLAATHPDPDPDPARFRSVARICQERGIPCVAVVPESDAAATTDDDDGNDADTRLLLTPSLLLGRVRELSPSVVFDLCCDAAPPAAVLAQGAWAGYGVCVDGGGGGARRPRCPVYRAVMGGDTETGLALYEMAGSDADAAVVARTAVPIFPDETAFDVLAKVAVVAEQMLWTALPGLMSKAQMTSDPVKAAVADTSLPLDYSPLAEPEDEEEEEGRVDWSKPAQQVYNLYRAVSSPYNRTGAWTLVDDARFVLARAGLSAADADSQKKESRLGLDVVDGRIIGRCGDGHLIDVRELRHVEGGEVVSPQTLQELLARLRTDDENGNRVGEDDESGGGGGGGSRPKHILILGINGFIGHHLTRRILRTTDWHVTGLDLSSHRIRPLLASPRLTFRRGDVGEPHAWAWAQRAARRCDVLVPLAAVATPAAYVRRALPVFELVFERALAAVRLAARLRKRLVLASSSEVYGMCPDAAFRVASSPLVCGPVGKPRWIYAASKQLLERVVLAYGEGGGGGGGGDGGGGDGEGRWPLDFTIVRPFNWFGSGLDALDDGEARVTTRFLGCVVRGEALPLVGGGAQRRTFCHVDDGVDALMRVLANEGGVATGKVYNVGNPDNELSIRELAGAMLEMGGKDGGVADEADGSRGGAVAVQAAEHYGDGYQDMDRRVPDISETCADLGWAPRVGMQEGLERLFRSYLEDPEGW